METTTRIIAGSRFGIIFLGLIGNSITFILFSRPVFEKNSISVYCRALAVFESFSLVDLIYECSVAFFNYTLAFHSNLSCIVFYYFGMTFGAIPGWILIAFSIDKLLSMKNIGISIIKKRSFQYTVITLIVLLNLLLYVEIPIYLRLTSVNGTNSTRKTCDVSSMPYAVLVSAIYSIEGSIVPFLIMFISSVMSIRLIRKSSKNLMTQSTLRNSRNQRDMKFAVTSIAFNFMFIILRLPIIVFLVIKSLTQTLNSTDLPLQLTYLLYFLNYSSGLIVHLVSNNIFRREFFVLFNFRRKRSLEIENQCSFGSNSLTNRT